MAATTAELIIHLEHLADEVVWWAESPQVPGFSAAAPTLAKLRELSLASLRTELPDLVGISEQLAGGEIHRSHQGWDAHVVSTDPVPC